MKTAPIRKAGGDFELIERDIPQPGRGQVRVKVEACGISQRHVGKGRYVAGFTISARPGSQELSILSAT